NAMDLFPDETTPGLSGRKPQRGRRRLPVADEFTGASLVDAFPAPNVKLLLPQSRTRFFSQLELQMVRVAPGRIPFFRASDSWQLPCLVRRRGLPLARSSCRDRKERVAEALGSAPHRARPFHWLRHLVHAAGDSALAGGCDGMVLRYLIPGDARIGRRNRGDRRPIPQLLPASVRSPPESALACRRNPGRGPIQLACPNEYK